MALQKPPGFGQNLVDEKAFARGIQNHIHLWHKKLVHLVLLIICGSKILP